MILGADLSGQSQSDLLAVGVTQSDLSLVNTDGGIFQLGQIDASLFFDIVADDLVDLDLLGHALLLGLGNGNVDVDLQGFVDQGHSVFLGLVFLSAVLVFSMVVLVLSVAGRSA